MSCEQALELQAGKECGRVGPRPSLGFPPSSVLRFPLDVLSLCVSCFSFHPFIWRGRAARGWRRATGTLCSQAARSLCRCDPAFIVFPSECKWGGDRFPELLYTSIHHHEPPDPQESEGCLLFLQCSHSDPSSRPHERRPRSRQNGEEPTRGVGRC